MQVPAFAGGAQSGRRDSGNRESAPASQGSPDHHRYDRGRDPDPYASFHQEPRAEPGSGDAPGEEGKELVCVTNTGASPWCCTEDGRGSPEAGLQEQASNRPVLLRSKDVVVSDWGKGITRCQVRIEKMSESEPSRTHRYYLKAL